MESGASETSEASRASNVGFVLCTKSFAPGTLNVRWIFTDGYRGPGIATGGSRDGFAGRDHVRYSFGDGAFSDEYDLAIAKNGDVYQASWLTDGERRAVGAGIEVENGLAVGWRKVGS